LFERFFAKGSTDFSENPKLLSALVECSGQLLQTQYLHSMCSAIKKNICKMEDAQTITEIIHGLCCLIKRKNCPIATDLLNLIVSKLIQNIEKIEDSKQQSYYLSQNSIAFSSMRYKSKDWIDITLKKTRVIRFKKVTQKKHVIRSCKRATHRGGMIILITAFGLLTPQLFTSKVIFAINCST
jgi:hypothetical protein